MPEPMWGRNISLPDDREGRPYGLERNCGENHRSAVGEAHEPPAQEASAILPEPMWKSNTLPRTTARVVPTDTNRIAVEKETLRNFAIPQGLYQQ